jgi:carbon monoxide dehydrogenase subunit G
MTTLDRNTFVNAPIEDIEMVTLDPTRLPEWYAGIEQVESDGVFPETGGQVSVLYKSAGIHFDLTMTSLEMVRGQGAVFQLEGMVTGTNRWTYAPEGDGTRVSVSFDYEIPGGALGKLADKLVVERMNADNLEKSLASLKALVEG